MNEDKNGGETKANMVEEQMQRSRRRKGKDCRGTKAKRMRNKNKDGGRTTAKMAEERWQRWWKNKCKDG